MGTTDFTSLTDEQKAKATEATYVPDETVTTKTAAPDVTTEAYDAATYEADEVSEDVTFDSASGTINNEEDLAFLNEKALTLSASGVKFAQEQKDRGIIDKVTGTLDDAAKATAAKVAGTTLPKVLRAKKQLRNAGLTEEEINLIGNNPEDLEDRLMDFTEEQRGMIGNLPEEALMGKQIESLLEGMESGEIPMWAKPAVSAVNQMLAQRGLSASTVGRDNLFNAVIQAAMPIAQSNAQTIKESAMQQIGIEAQAAQQDAQMAQQTALSNADKVFNLNMKQFDVDVQTELANKKFLQTTSLTEVANEQQATIQNAVNQTQLDLANLSTQEKLAVRNADAFLNMNLTNLNLDQQGRVLEAQQEQQRLLSNQAATNASLQFNATSENQTNQFMTGLEAQIDMNNVARNDAMSQFNATQENAAEARRVGIEADIDKFNAQLVTQVSEFNANQEFARNQWLAQNAEAVEASNVQWRRNANLADTAAQNTVNMQNAQNAFNLSQTASSFLWQEMRDQADYNFREAENDKNRIAQLVNTAIASDPSKYAATSSLETLISAIIGDITT